MSIKTNSLENAYLLLLFNNTAFANVGDASGLQPSATAGSLHCSLHTADPGEDGNQTTNEVAYTGYARAAVARTAGGWTVSGNTVTNTAEVAWPICTGGTATATHVGIGTAASGTGVLLYRVTMGASLAISNNITPKAAAGQISVTEE